MVLDTRTLVFVNVIFATLMGSGLFIASKDYDGQVKRSMRLIGLALIGITLGGIFLGLRGFIPDLISILPGNLLLLWADLEIYHGLRVFDGDQFQAKPYLILIAAVICVNLYFYFIIDSLSFRTALVTGVAAFLTGLSARQLIYYRKPPSSNIRLIAGIGFCLLVGIYIFRIFYLINPSIEMVSVFDNTPLQLLIYGGTFIGLITITFGYLLMCTSLFNAELKMQTMIDPLSGLFNRRAVEVFAEKEIFRAKRTKEPLALIMIDADNFKKINDVYGHAVGDCAIMTIASVIRQTFRNGDLIGRIGGDEFVVLLPNTPKELVDLVSSRLTVSLSANPMVFEDKRIILSVSTGSAMLDWNNPDYDTMSRQADRSLYLAKQKLIDACY